MKKELLGPELTRLIQLLSRLPGLGPRSARRAALHLLNSKEQLLEPLASVMQLAVDWITTCEVCGNLDTRSPCGLCLDSQRNAHIICVVEQVSDLWALERAGTLNCSYHVLGGVLSPLDGIGPDELSIPGLLERVRGEEVREVILALNATVEGQTTVHYLSDLLHQEENIQVTCLAHGVPVGGELDYLDEGTLAAALSQRKSV